MWSHRRPSDGDLAKKLWQSVLDSMVRLAPIKCFVKRRKIKWFDRFTRGGENETFGDGGGKETTRQTHDTIIDAVIEEDLRSLRSLKPVKDIDR